MSTRAACTPPLHAAAVCTPQPARRRRAHLSGRSRGASSAHSVRQKPSLTHTTLRSAVTCARALAALMRWARIRYAMTSVAERLTPAPQCTSTAAGGGRGRGAGLSAGATSGGAGGQGGKPARRTPAATIAAAGTARALARALLAAAQQ
jgi:hypothetical protein